MSFLISTTGTIGSVTLNDLGSKTFTHPVTNYELENNYSIYQILESKDLGSALDSGYVTVNFNGINITTSSGLYPATGTIPISRGGTNLTSPGTANQLLGVNSGATSLEYKTITSINNLIQIAYTDLTVDTTTTSVNPNFVDLLSSTFNTGSNYINVTFTASASNSEGDKSVLFRLMIDGTVKKSGVVFSKGNKNFADSSAITHRQSVSSGSHTVKVQWCVEDKAGRIRPITVPNQEHAALIIYETVI